MTGPIPQGCVAVFDGGLCVPASRWTYPLQERVWRAAGAHPAAMRQAPQTPEIAPSGGDLGLACAPRSSPVPTKHKACRSQHQHRCSLLGV